MPIAYLDRIARIPGIQAVMPGNCFAGVRQDGSQFFGQWTVDQENVFEIYPELKTRHWP